MKNYFSQSLRDLLEIVRSPKWRAVRAHHLKLEPWCRYCGSQIDLEVHHIIPVHTNPSLELDPENLITLCETRLVECHLRQGHLGNWSHINPNIRLIANSPHPHQPHFKQA